MTATATNSPLPPADCCTPAAGSVPRPAEPAARPNPGPGARYCPACGKLAADGTLNAGWIDESRSYTHWPCGCAFVHDENETRQIGFGELREMLRPPVADLAAVTTHRQAVHWARVTEMSEAMQALAIDALPFHLKDPALNLCHDIDTWVTSERAREKVEQPTAKR